MGCCRSVDWEVTVDRLSFAGSRVLLCPLAVDRVLRCVSGSSSVRALEPARACALLGGQEESLGLLTI